MTKKQYTLQVGEWADKIDDLPDDTDEANDLYYKIDEKLEGRPRVDDATFKLTPREAALLKL